MACFPVRYQIAFMMFWHCYAVYMVRVNISVNILAMRKDAIAKPFPNQTRVAEVKPNNYYSHYNWSAHEESNLVGAYYYGYVATSLLGGMICEMYGTRMVAGISLGLNAVLTFLTPISVGIHFWVVFFCRILNGMLAGIAFPGNQALIAKWAPPNERGIFVATIIGSSIGTWMTWIISSLISENFGWDWAFYASGFICFVIMVFWFIIVADEPSKHWYVKDEERGFIEDSLKGFILRAKRWPPFRHVITSLPFYATIILHYGHMWNLYFQLTSAPQFFLRVLKLRLTIAATLAGMPYLVRSISVFGFAAISDIIRRKNLLETTMTRKIFCTFSHMIPAFLLLLVAAFVENTPVCVTLLCICMGFNASAVATNLINVQDLAPNFAATLYGVMNFFANTSGFLTPIMVAEITKNDNTPGRWKIIFVINSVMYIVPAFLFLIFGTGELQPWNMVDSSGAII